MDDEFEREYLSLMQVGGWGPHERGGGKWLCWADVKGRACHLTSRALPPGFGVSDTSTVLEAWSVAVFTKPLLSGMLHHCVC